MMSSDKQNENEGGANPGSEMEISMVTEVIEEAVISESDHAW